MSFKKRKARDCVGEKGCECCTSDKILNRMNDLQEAMESNQHMEDSEKVMAKLLSVSKFWTMLEEEDRDYIQCAIHAIEERLEWNV